MIEVIERYIEIAVSIFVYVSCTVMVIALLRLSNTPIINLTKDKTFIESDGVQELYEEELYGRDILLLLINTDPMAPYPKAIKINNTPVIKLTNEFVSNKMTNVGLIYSKNGEYRLSEILEHRVISKEYIYKGNDAPYIHYILEEVN